MLYAAGFLFQIRLFFPTQEHQLRRDERSRDRPGQKQSHADRVLSAVVEKVAQDGNGKPGDDRCSRSALPRKRHPLSHRSREFFRAVGRPAESQGLYCANQTGSFFAERETKAADEVRHITESLRVAKLGLEAGIRALKRTKIGRDGYLYLNGSRLTSETLKTAVNTTIMAQGWLPSHTIISSGNQCVDPHHEGTGPIKAHTSIIFDIFPRSQKNGYFGDLSRTVVRGRATDKLKAIYATVQAGQQIGFDMIRDGINGRDVHQKILALFEARGFPTGRIKGECRDSFTARDTAWAWISMNRRGSLPLKQPYERACGHRGTWTLLSRRRWGTP